MPSFYPQVANKNYVNVFYALCIALDEFFAKMYLNNDDKRIVYSTTDYALIKRSGQSETWSNANLPFLNYKMSGKEAGGNRNWFSMEAFSQGVYVEELRKKLRIAPISITLDCSYWTSRDDDFQYAIDKTLIDNSAETRLRYFLDFNGTLVSNIAIVNLELDASIKFTEQDWLERNNINCLGLNPTIQTFLPLDTVDGFCIPKKVLIDFCVKKELTNNVEAIEEEELFELVVNHFNQTITEK